MPIARGVGNGKGDFIRFAVRVSRALADNGNEGFGVVVVIANVARNGVKPCVRVDVAEDLVGICQFNVTLRGIDPVRLTWPS